MQVFNIHRGRATNSSSSHDIVFISDPKMSAIDQKAPNDAQYGWEDFVLASRFEKAKYLLTWLISQLYQACRYISSSHLPPQG